MEKKRKPPILVIYAMVLVVALVLLFWGVSRMPNTKLYYADRGPCSYEVIAQSQQKNYLPARPESSGEIATAEQAAQTARAIWVDVWGEETTGGFKNCNVYLDEEAGIWYVEAVPNDKTAAWPPHVFLRRSDGAVLAVWASFYLYLPA